ncbi:MAG TPA: GGDEF domain-containing protein [Gemmatimonadaceae bacterium]|nr:GGDEF domain-containing protein [Gemmatimonadaceae bacterium]
MTTALDRGFRWMYFPARLEQLFELETGHARSRHLVGIGILWIVVGVLYAIVGGFGPASVSAHAWSVYDVRLAVVTPILVAVTFAIWWGVPPFTRELAMMVANIIAPASIILVITFADGSDVGVNRGALTIVLLFITVVVRLRFWFAVTACIAIVAVQVGVPSLVGAPVPGNVPLVLITIAATLVANYQLERESRLNYLQRLLTRIQGAQLAASVVQFQDLAQRDPLTGLPNRRAIDAQLDALCERGEQFAVIMVDVDVFKTFNDHYGHVMGDDCLRRVAAMLRASLRNTSDQIARVGGEEFVVVLPQTSVENARIMAERMRHAVYGLRIPHAGSPQHVVTISAGVSGSTAPTSAGEVLSAADAAMYRAKSLGRNRVELATEAREDATSPARGLAVSA